MKTVFGVFIVLYFIIKLLSGNRNFYCIGCLRKVSKSASKACKVRRRSFKRSCMLLNVVETFQLTYLQFVFWAGMFTKTIRQLDLDVYEQLINSIFIFNSYLKSLTNYIFNNSHVRNFRHFQFCQLLPRF